MRQMVRNRDYVATIHAEDEMHDEGLTVLDVEKIVLSGEILNRQKDEETGEWKYVIGGRTIDSAEGCVVAKFGPTDRLVIITVYLGH